MRTSLFVLLCLIAFVNCDRITKLPGLTFNPGFDQYSGYINVTNPEGMKRLFYWFVESQNDPTSDPVVLWMQGGPGCSGLIGFFQENGPFLIKPNGHTLEPNPFSWNKNASVIYLEQPCGVGFSVSDYQGGYSNNDTQAGLDNIAFLEGFFDEFPQYSTNDFWITGESYGGVYVPTLAKDIVTGSNQQLKDNLKGFMIGNPVLQCEDFNYHSAEIDLLYFHGMVSYQNRFNWYLRGCDKEVTSICEGLYNKMIQDIGPYEADNVYFDYCTGNGTLDFLDSNPGCLNIDNRPVVYLNKQSVRDAIYVDSSAGDWIPCSRSIDYTSLNENMLDYYNYFFNYTDLAILIYSGDNDIGDVPNVFTQTCLAQLNRRVVKPWQRWTVQGPLIPLGVPGFEEKSLITAGYVEKYDKFTYVTIRGAGHEAPQFQPYFAEQIFHRFITTQTIQ